MADSGQATFSVNLTGNAGEVSARTAKALDGLQARANQAQESIKNMSGSLRMLRGNSEEVKSAKDKLRTAIDAERSALSAATVGMLKAGSSLGELNKAQKNAESSVRGAGGVIKLIGGPVAELQAKTQALAGAFEGASVEALAVVGPLALVAAGVAALAVGAAALTAGVVAGTVALAKFVITNGDMMRNLSLSRQGIAGSAADSERMGDQIDRLRQKIPLTTEEFSKLYKGIRTTFDQSRVDGKGILEVVTTIASTTGAMGDEAAAKVRSIAERGKEIGRFQLSSGFNPFSGGNGKSELAGTGIQFQDVAAALAKNTGISIAAATKALNTGRVKYIDGIKALREASDKAFGEINANKMLSLDSISKKLHDDWAGLLRGVDITPFLKQLSNLENLFSKTTPTGYALSVMIKAFGTALNGSATKGGPLLEQAMKRLVIGAQRLTIFVLQNRDAWSAGFDSLKDSVGSVIDAFKTALDIARDLGVTIDKVAKGISFVSDVGNSFAGFGPKNEQASAVRDSSFAGAGPLGIVASLASKAFGSATAPGHSKGGIVGSISPGETFARVMSTSTMVAPANDVGGMVMKPAPGEAFASVAPGESIVPAAQAGRASTGGGGSTTINVGGIRISVSVEGGKSGSAQEHAQAIQNSSLLPQLVKAIEDAFKGAGIPTQAVAA